MIVRIYYFFILHIGDFFILYFIHAFLLLELLKFIFLFFLTGFCKRSIFKKPQRTNLRPKNNILLAEQRTSRPFSEFRSRARPLIGQEVQSARAITNKTVGMDAGRAGSPRQ